MATLKHLTKQILTSKTFKAAKFKVTYGNQARQSRLCSNGIMLAVALFLSSKRFLILYHPFRVFVKNDDPVDISVILFLP